MKHTRMIAAILVLMTVFSCLNMRVLATDDVQNDLSSAAVTNGCHTLDATSTYLGTKQITDNISSAIVYETNSDTLMYSLNADDKVYPSSLVKILTALIAVEKGDLQEEITITQEVLDTVPYYAASAELVADEKMSLSDLLYCMMVGSANDAAAVIATHISGSQEAFVKEMNAYADAVGCTGTQIVNVHGLHDERQFTTTRDMARILAAAVMNADFLTYFTAVYYDVPATNKSELRELSSSNYLMNMDNMQIYYDDRVKGGRTGVAEDGARCLASLAEQDSMRLICIVMGSESTFADDGRTLTYGSFQETSALLDVALEGYKVVQILYEGQVLQQCNVPNGKNDVVLGSMTSAYSVLPANITVSDLSYRYEDKSSQLQAPISLGQALSSVEVWYGSLCVGQAELVALNDVSLVEIQQQGEDAGDNDGDTNVAVVIIITVAICAVCVLLFVKFSGRVRAYFTKKHDARYRRNRRRSR